MPDYAYDDAMRDGETIGDQFVDGLEPCDIESPAEAYEANARRSAHITSLTERMKLLERVREAADDVSRNVFTGDTVYTAVIRLRGALDAAKEVDRG